MGEGNEREVDLHYPKPRFKYWWACWIIFVLTAAYLMYGFVLSGEVSMLEYILFILAMSLYPGLGCYKVRKMPEGEVPIEGADSDIETSRVKQNLED